MTKDFVGKTYFETIIEKLQKKCALIDKCTRFLIYFYSNIIFLTFWNFQLKMEKSKNFFWFRNLRLLATDGNVDLKNTKNSDHLSISLGINQISAMTWYKKLLFWFDFRETSINTLLTIIYHKLDLYVCMGLLTGIFKRNFLLNIKFNDHTVQWQQCPLLLRKAVSPKLIYGKKKLYSTFLKLLWKCIL